MINSFKHEYSFLSNFYPSEVELDGVVYPTVENAYQAAKTCDEEARLNIQCLTPGQAKRAGRKVNLRSDWDNVKVQVMGDLVLKKFVRPDLREALLATGNQELVEGNYWGDIFWGVYKGEGSNYLGKILMGVRDYIK